MMNRTHFATHDRSALVSVIFNLALPHRIALHMLSVVGRAVLTPLIQLVLGIMVKRVLGLNTACLAASCTQLTILRRYINSVLLSQKALNKAFRILGSHYEVVSVSFHVSFLWNIRHDLTPVYRRRLCIEPWEPRLAKESTGLAQEYIVLIRSC
jgi:hypothetical protein